MNYVIPAVVSHHERYDGKGYPRGLKGEEIPLLGRQRGKSSIVKKRHRRVPLFKRGGLSIIVSFVGSKEGGR